MKTAELSKDPARRCSTAQPSARKKDQSAKISTTTVDSVESREALHAAYLLTQKNLDKLSYKLLIAYQGRGALVEVKWQHVMDLLHINAIVEAALSVMPKEKPTLDRRDSEA